MKMMKKITSLKQKTGLKHQQGMSFLGLMVLLVIAGFIFYIGLKVIPAYIDYFAIKKIFVAMASSEEVKTGTVADIRRSFDKRISIDYATAIKGEDLDITKDGNETVVAANWQHKIPLFPTWTLTIDFATTTAGK
jgi:Tfp pilus assembly major pilin PilA